MFLNIKYFALIFQRSWINNEINKNIYRIVIYLFARRKEMMYTGELIRWFISNVGEKLSLVHEHRETRVSREKNISRENCSLAEKRVARTSGVGSGIIGLGKNVLETGSVILLGRRGEIEKFGNQVGYSRNRYLLFINEKLEV